MAVIQLNDPDPLYWIVVYAIVAVVPATKALGLQSAKLTWVASGMVAGGLLVAMPGFIDYLSSGDFASIAGEMMNSKPYVESAREFGGLIIAAFTLAIYQRRTPATTDAQR